CEVECNEQRRYCRFFNDECVGCRTDSQQHAGVCIKPDFTHGVFITTVINSGQVNGVFGRLSARHTADALNFGHELCCGVGGLVCNRTEGHLCNQYVRESAALCIDNGGAPGVGDSEFQTHSFTPRVRRRKVVARQAETTRRRPVTLTPAIRSYQAYRGFTASIAAATSC